MASREIIKRKIVIVGDGACGKTSLLCVFTLGEFPKVSPSHRPPPPAPQLTAACL